MASGSPTTAGLQLSTLAAAVTCALLLLAGRSSASQPLPSRSGDFEDDRVHDFLRVLDRAAAYRRECFGECAKGCYCADNPYSCLRECMPTPPTRRCGATYDLRGAGEGGRRRGCWRCRRRGPLLRRDMRETNHRSISYTVS
ncbi:hypothetical protein C2845_PM18G01790 [Panicum miliaceum]|uniref:Uncharacterized protein n=1 Tax=Panicum miliaceum TaxID=4540 RepID=A0A3L6PJR6_PANMI|nr:hypothetical protein C2845_PM18G01790 [Panicum miliaceum]